MIDQREKKSWQNKKKKNSSNSDMSEAERIQMEISRIKLPRGRECLGLVEQRLGGSRMRVKCLDGKTRICRIPGRLKRTLWVREGNIVIAEPWELSGDERGDIVYKYTNVQVEHLKRQGHLNQLEDTEEF